MIFVMSINSIQSFTANLLTQSTHSVNVAESQIYFFAEHTICFYSPCMNGETCVDQAAGGYMCKCSAGYEGTNCTISKNALQNRDKLHKNQLLLL